MPFIKIDGVLREIDEINLTLKPLTIPDTPPVVLPPTSNYLNIGEVTIKIPVSNPEPFGINPPTRFIPVSGDAAFAKAAEAAQPGDCIVLGPGLYNVLKIHKSGTEAKRILVVGRPGANVLSMQALGGSYVSFIGLSVGYGSIVINSGAHHIDVIACTIKTKDKNDGIWITNQDTGGFRFINNWIEWIGDMKPGQWGAEAYGGINFQADRPAGRDILIARNNVRGFKDLISMGETSFVGSENLVIRKNYLWDATDDAIQLESQGGHRNFLVENNVIGGTELSVLVGVAISPCGGPGVIQNNSISGYQRMPVKFNHGLTGFTDGIDINNNVMVQALTEDPIGWYFGRKGEMLNVRNISIERNIIRTHGGIYIVDDGTIIPGLKIDGNRLWSTGKRPYSGGALFRFVEPETGKNYYTSDLAKLRAKFGHEMNGRMEDVLLRAVQVEPSVPVEKLCRWEEVK